MADTHTQAVEHTAEVGQPAAAHGEDHGGGGNALLSVDPGLVMWVWIVFFAFLIVLRKFAWGPIVKALDERESTIRKSLEDADAATTALAEATQRQAAIIADGEKEAKEIVSKSREAAKSVASDIEAKAREEANRIVEDARTTIEGEKLKAISDIRKEAADLAVMAATKLINTNLDDAKNRELVQSHIGELTS